jgi:ubiquinone/menaquinone biosynthesis C-methylase UbiE
MASFDELAADYDAGRTGYSSDLYNSILGYGLSARQHTLDVGCGTGLASRPLIENGVAVTGVDVSEPMIDIARKRSPAATWVVGAAEKLPFENHSFDAAISAQTFHHFDRTAAMRELVRVLRPGGIMAIWWKALTNEDPVKMLRDDVMRDLGHAPVPSGISGGFKEFYAADLANHTLRVIPWRVMTGLGEYLTYERSRKIVHDTLGRQVNDYLSQLEGRLRAQFGEGNPMLPLSYLQFLYLGRTR